MFAAAMNAGRGSHPLDQMGMGNFALTEPPLDLIELPVKSDMEIPQKGKTGLFTNATTQPAAIPIISLGEIEQRT